MSSFNKIKYSFVLCLALLFSFCFAGTLTVNGNNYTFSDLSGDYSVTTQNNYIVYGLYNSNDELIELDVRTVDSGQPVSYGGLYSVSSSTTRLYACTSNNTTTNYLGSRLVFNVDTNSNNYGQINYYYSNLSNTVITSNDFPLIIDNSNRNFSNLAYTDNSGYFDFYYSSFDLYYLNSFNPISLGEKFFTAGDYINPNEYVVPPFTVNLSQQEINDISLNLLNSSAVFDNLPDTYTNFFIKQDLNGDYVAYFYPNYYYCQGILYMMPDGETVNYYNFRFLTLNNSLLTLFMPDDIYVFTSYSGSDFVLTKTMDMAYFLNHREDYYDYYEEPIIYSFPDINFHIWDENLPGVSETVQFTVTGFDITNSNNETITSQDVLANAKTDNSIWTMLYNIFNPPTSTSSLNALDQQHETIISNADNNSFFGLFNSSSSLISSLSSLTWLITACNLLFSYFSSLLILCCVFITISRVMR